MKKQESNQLLGSAFLGLQIYQLIELINVQGNELLQFNQLEIPSRATSTLMLLYRQGPLSVTQIGSILGMSHQLVALRIKPLMDLKMIENKKDPSDKRRTLLQLTSKGRIEIKAVDKLCQRTEKVYSDLFDETGVNLFEGVDAITRALKKRSLYERMEALEND